MATERELRKRIRSIRNIGQVTRALEAVSASHVRRAQARVLATRPYALKAWEVLVHIASQAEASARLHPLLEAREEITALSILLLSSDRGLCGAFNFNIVRRTLQFIQSLDLPTTLVTVGRKGRDLMYRAGQSISADFSDFPVDPSILDVTPIAHVLRSGFRERRADIVYLAYMEFVNTLVQRPVVRRLLPLRPPSIEDQAVAEFIAEAPVLSDEPLEYIYEPSAAAILDEILPRFT